MLPAKKLLVYIGVPLVAFFLVTGVALFFIFCYDSPQAVDETYHKAGPKLVIDHDGGADDALAITMSLLYEKFFNGPNVVALTTTYGNVNRSQVIINSARILELLNRSDVPIYVGAEKTLISGIESDYFFGYDGLGDDGYMNSGPIAVEEMHAAVGLIELSKKYEGELIIMSIGPATNIALAITMDPHFIDRLAQLYVGSGHMYSESHPDPEFNAEMDVEAYYIVADSARVDKVTFIPFSQVLGTLNITKDWRVNVLGAIDTPTIQALNGYERLSLAASKSWTLLDPAVAAIVLDNNIVTEFRNSSNGIILCGPQRGINTNELSSSEPNSRLVYSANVEDYKKFLIDIYSAELKSNIVNNDCHLTAETRRKTSSCLDQLLRYLKDLFS